jgi:phospholipid-binding lipoprotein MlaA
MTRRFFQSNFFLLSILAFCSSCTDTALSESPKTTGSDALITNSTNNFEPNKQVDAAAADDEIEDPMEEWNRSILSFNCLMRDILIHPISVFYENLVPDCIQKGIRNVIGNLSQPFSVVNSILQLDGEKTQLHLTKLLINTTFGICGWVDVADLLGLSLEQEDFGKTLKHAGFGPGPFMMLPVLGPCHLRDSFGITADFFLQVPGYSALYSVLQNSMQSLIDYCDYKEPWKLIEEKFDDPYVTMRHAYYESRGDLKEPAKEVDDSDDTMQPSAAAQEKKDPSTGEQEKKDQISPPSGAQEPLVSPDSQKEKANSEPVPQQDSPDPATAENQSSEKKDSPLPNKKQIDTQSKVSPETSRDEDLFPGIDDMDWI